MFTEFIIPNLVFTNLAVADVINKRKINKCNKLINKPRVFTNSPPPTSQ